jgi:type IV pilus assembly protein PilM
MRFVFRRKKAVVGLDVGTHAVKAIQLRGVGGQISIIKVGYEDIPDENQRNEALRKLVSESGLKGRDVVSSVSGRSVIVRYVNLRRMDKSELQNAIRFEADKYIPFSVDEVVLDCQPIDGAENLGPDEMKVLLVAVKRNLIEEHVAMLRGAGVNPVVIDVDGFALGNAHQLIRDPSDRSVRALVDIGASKTNINILSSGKSLFTREVYVGGADFTSAIAQRLAVDPYEVEQVKQDPNQREDEIRDAVQSVTDDLGNEIRLSLDFFENEFDRPVDTVTLSGGASRLVGLRETLGENFEKPTDVWDPASTFQTNLAPAADDLFKEKATQMAVAIGLAARLGGH